MADYEFPYSADQIKTVIDHGVNSKATIEGTSANFVQEKAVAQVQSDLAADIADNAADIATNAAAIAGISTALPFATFTHAAGNTGDTGAIGAYTEVDDGNIASHASGIVTLTAGSFLVSWNGSFAEEDNDTTDYYTVHARVDSTNIASIVVNETGSYATFTGFSATTVITSVGSKTVSFYAQEVPHTVLFWQNLTITIVKIA